MQEQISRANPYKIKLDIFEGPLDLLLYLIKKNEVNIYDIPIAGILEQYLEYLKLMKLLDLNVAGEFIVIVGASKYREKICHNGRCHPRFLSAQKEEFILDLGCGRDAVEIASGVRFGHTDTTDFLAVQSRS